MKHATTRGAFAPIRLAVWVAVAAIVPPRMAAAAPPVPLVSVTPHGDVSTVRQVVVHFSEPMNQASRDGPPPATLRCDHDALVTWRDVNGHWIGAETFAIDLDRALRPHLTCVVAVRAGLRSLAGAVTAPTPPATLRTGGPAIQRVLPEPGEHVTIVERQAFALLMNGPLPAAEIVARTHCEVTTGATVRREPVVAVAEAEQALLAKALGFAAHADRVGIVRCEQSLPPGAHVRVAFAPEASASGAAPLEAQHVDYVVRSGFAAAFVADCGTDWQRVQRRGGMRCDVGARRIDARGNVRVDFSRPVPIAQALRVRLRSASGERAPQLGDLRVTNASLAQPDVTSIVFDGPFAAGDQPLARIPADLVDRDGAHRFDAAIAPVPVAVVTGLGNDVDAVSLATGAFAVRDRAAGATVDVDSLTSVRLHGARVLRVSAEARAGTGFDDAALMHWVDLAQRYRDGGLARRDAVALDLGDAVAARAHALSGAPNQAAAAQVVSTSALSLLDGQPSAASRPLAAQASSVAAPDRRRAALAIADAGLHVVEVAYDAPDNDEVVGLAHARSVVLVTDLAVHLVGDSHGVLAWVTSLATGAPVAGATVQMSDCGGHRLAAGITDDRGAAWLPATASSDDACPDAVRSHAAADRFVTARRAIDGGRQDVAFAWTSWSEGGGYGAFASPRKGETAALDADSVQSFAGRKLLAPGQVVAMKHWLRRSILGGFALPPRATWPSEVVLTDPAGDTTVLPLAWSDRGDAQWHWPVPTSARRGTWSVGLAQGDRRVRVSWFEVRDFRIPEVDATLKALETPWHAGRPGTLEVTAAYFNGGPAVGLQVELDSVLETALPDGDDVPSAPQPFVYAGDGYAFDRGPGRRVDAEHWEAGGLGFETEFESKGQDASTRDAQPGPHRSQLVDAQGHARFEVPTGTDPRVASAQASVRFADPDGEVRRMPLAVPVWPSTRRIGIKLARGDDGVRLQVALTDLAEKPVAGAALRLEAAAEDTLREPVSFDDGLDTVRVRDTWHALALPSDCQLVTDAAGRAECLIKTVPAGRVQFAVSVADESGVLAQTYADTPYTYEPSRFGRSGLSGASGWSNQQPGLPPPLEPLKVDADAGVHQVGETVHARVAGRFDRQPALLLIEADGLLEWRAVVLDGVDPSFAWTVDRRWLSGVQVEVLALEPGRFDYGQGRVGGVPARVMRVGRGAFSVDVAPAKLVVDVKADAAQFRPGETAHLRVHVTRADGRAAPPGTHVALAVVDEALFKLLPNDLHELEEALARQRQPGVAIAGMQWRPAPQPERTLLSTDAKSAAAAAYGVQRVEITGSSMKRVDTAARLRSVFDTALAWLPDVALDADGTATVDVPVNDSLAHWHVIAVADGATADEALLAGSGEAAFDSRQPLQLTAGLPAVVHTGDRYRATLAIRNDTDQAVRVRVTARAGRSELGERSADVAAQGRVDVAWDAAAPDAPGELAWEFGAAGGASGDRVEFRQQVMARVPTTVRQATLVQVTGVLDVPLQPLADPKATLTLQARPSLGADLPGVAEFFRGYRYRCLEQRVSLAVGQRDAKAWQGIADDLATYLDDNDLPTWFPPRSDAQELLLTGSGAAGSDELASYLLSITAQARRQGLAFELPPAAGRRLLDALSKVADGALSRDEGRLATGTTSQSTLRRVAAIAALARWGEARPAMLDGVPIDLAWPTSTLLDLREIVADVPALPERDALRARIDDALRARLDQRGTRVSLVARPADRIVGLMAHPDVDAIRLALLAVDDPAWQSLAPRLVAGALARQQHGHWATTVANAWGTLLMAEFAQRFEAQPVAGTTLAGAGNAAPSAIVDWRATPAGASATLPLPAGAAPSLRLEQRGTGAPWVSVLESAALPVTRPANHGFAIRKTITPVTPHPDGAFQRGDLVRVHLDIEAAADVEWVVVDDPLPAGAAVPGNLIGRDPLMRRQGWRGDAAEPAYIDQRVDRYQAFFARLPAGHFGVDYVMRLDTAGRLGLPATRVEAMYDPEMFGEWPNAAIVVAPR